MSNREEHRDEDQRTTQPQDEDDIHMEIEGQQERDSERPSTLLQMTQGKAKKKRKLPGAGAAAAASASAQQEYDSISSSMEVTYGSQSQNLFTSQSPLGSPSGRSPIGGSPIVDLSVADDSEEDSDESEQSSNVSLISAQRGARGSFTWEYFLRRCVYVGVGPDREKIVTATCVICSFTIRVDDGSTTKLRNHLKRVHKSKYLEMKKKEEDATQKAKPKPAQAKEKMRQASIANWKAANQVNTASQWLQGEERSANATRAILDYIVHSNKPFSTVDDPRFWKLICHFQPNYKIPSRKTFRDMIPARVKEMKASLRRSLNQASDVSFTTDIWTTKNNKASHISVTCHWITTDWQRRDFVLACTPFPVKHTAENIAKKLKEAFSEWGLNPPADADAEISSTPARAIDLSSTGSDVQSSISPPQSQPQVPVKHTIVRDGAANMRAGCDQITDTKNVQCVIHLLQLVVKHAVLDNIKIQPILRKCRQICQYVHQSHQATVEFRNIQMQSDPEKKESNAKQLIGDVATRWNSTYIMLGRILELKESLKEFLTKAAQSDPVWGRERNITPDEWEIIRNAVTQLKPFFKYTEIMSANKVSIGMTIFIIQCIKGEVESNHPDGDLLPLKPELLKHLEMRFFGGDVASRKVWYNILTDPRFTIPCLLHPLMKTKVFKKKSQRIQARSAVPVTYWHVLITLYFIKSVLILVEI